MVQTIFIGSSKKYLHWLYWLDLDMIWQWFKPSTREKTISGNSIHGAKSSPSPYNEMLHKGCKSLTSIVKWSIYWWSYCYSCFYSLMYIGCFLFVVFMGQHRNWSNMILTHIKRIIYYFAGECNTSLLLFLLYWILFMCGFQWWMYKVIWAIT